MSESIVLVLAGIALCACPILLARRGARNQVALGAWSPRAITIGLSTVLIGMLVLVLPNRLFETHTMSGQVAERVYIAAISAILVWFVSRLTKQRVRDVWHWQPRVSARDVFTLLPLTLGMAYAPFLIFVGIYALADVSIGGYVGSLSAPLALLVAVTAGVGESIVLALAVTLTRHYGGNLVACIAAMTALFAWGHAYQGPMIATVFVWVPLHMWLFARTGSVLILILPHVYMDALTLVSHAPVDILSSSITVALLLLPCISIGVAVANWREAAKVSVTSAALSTRQSPSKESRDG